MTKLVFGSSDAIKILIHDKVQAALNHDDEYQVWLAQVKILNDSIHDNEMELRAIEGGNHDSQVDLDDLNQELRIDRENLSYFESAMRSRVNHYTNKCKKFAA